MLKLMYILSLIGLFSYFIMNLTPNNEIYLNDCIENIKNNNVKEVTIFEKHIEFVFLNNKKLILNTNGDNVIKQNIIELCLKHKDKITLKVSKYNFFIGLIKNNFVGLLLVLLSIISLFMVMDPLSQISKFDFKITKNNSVKFDDIVGCEEAKNTFKEIIKFLKNPDIYKKNKIKMYKGVLLYGPAGNGKTLLARAVANAAGCSFLYVSASEFEEMFVGLGASRVRELFKVAKKNSPIIIFIDEIDCLDNKENSGQSSNSNKQLINQFLVELDGFEERDNIIIIAATNDFSKMNETLLRSGRFDKKILISCPELEERKQILLLNLKDKSQEDDLNIENISRRTAGFSAADLVLLINEAAILALKEKRKISNEDINIVFEKITENIDSTHNTKVNLSDIGGMDEIISEVHDIIDFLRNSDRYKNFGAVLPKGILLHGPPGNGKTLLAKAIATEANCGFIYVSASEFNQKYVGEGEKKIKKIFSRARNFKKCIIFIDELDSIGRRDDNNSYNKSIINQLLTEIDGFKKLDNVFIIAATNNLNQVDSALIRSGRFDKKLNIDYPTINGRKAILRALINKQKLKIVDDFDMDLIAKITSGFSGADLAQLLNDSAINAVKRFNENNEEIKDSIDENQKIKENGDLVLNDIIEMQDIFKAYDNMTIGVERKDDDRTHADLELTAYHEAGHALLGYYLCKDFLTIYKATIVSRSQAAGLVSFFQVGNKLTNKEEFINKIKMMLAGRAGEEVLRGSDSKITTGASNDLEKATDILKKMIEQCGLGENLINLSVINKQSEKTKMVIEQQIEESLKEIYKFVLNFLKDHKKEHEALAKALLEKKTLDLKEIEAVIKSV